MDGFSPNNRNGSAAPGSPGALDGLAVNAYDAGNNRFTAAEAHVQNGKLSLTALPDGTHAPEYYLSPGWIDIHTHIFDGFGIIGMNADEIGWKTGVCLVSDAGTTGDFTLDGFKRYVAPTIRTGFRLFLCISPIGVISQHEYSDMESLDPERTAQTVLRNRDLICGVKVRIAANINRREGVEPLRLAADAARRADVPLMVHIGRNPPALADVEPFMRSGDIITHCFNGKSNDTWNPDGSPAPAMARMLERGVLLDVGHGGGSFSFDVCERALRHGYGRGLPGFMIGTDLHAISRTRYAYSMATTMSKMLGLGMTIEDVIYGVTALPAAVLGLTDWCRSGAMENATLFRIAGEPDDYEDTGGVRRRFPKKIKPCGILLRGEYIELGADF